MSDRIGTCGGCGAKFKIPASFQGNKAKCNKCGGVVEVGGAAAAPAAAAPAAETATSSSRSSRSSRAGGRSSAGGRGRGSRAGGRRGAKAEAEASGRSSRAGRGGGGRREAKKDNTMMYVGIGAGVVVVAALAFFLMKGGDETPVDETAVASTDNKPAETPAAAPADSPADMPMSATTKEAEPEPDAPPPPPPPEPEPDPTTIDTSNPVVSFDPVPKPPTLNDDEWTALNDAIRKGYLESSRPKDQKASRKEVFAAEAAAVPALINALNGLDFSNDIDFRNAGAIVLAIQDVSADMIKIPFKLDILEREANMESNLNIVNQLLKYWTKYDSDDAFPDFVTKLEERRAKQAEQVDPEDW